MLVILPRWLDCVLVILSGWLDGLCWSSCLGVYMVCFGQPPSVVGLCMLVSLSLWLAGCVGQPLSVVRWFVLVSLSLWLDGLCWSAFISGLMVCVLSA